MVSESPAGRQIHVLLTLLDGERSFGMALAQKKPTMGPKYTVVSSVFANSPAARAGIRQGYVVRYINDKSMADLTVAQVANNFRNVAQASITLEIVHTASPRTSAFTTAATFGGVTANQAARGQRSVAPVTGFSTASSGRAIAAPGSALATPRVAAAKQSVLRLSAKPAAKTLAAAGMTGSAVASGKGGVMPSADAKRANGASLSGLKSKAVAPVLRLGPTPKSVQPDVAARELAKQDVPKPAAKSVPESSVAEKVSASSRVPRSPIQAIEAPKRAPAQVKKATAPEQPRSTASPPVRANAITPVPAPPKSKATEAAAPRTTSNELSTPTTPPVKATPADVGAPPRNSVLPPAVPEASSVASSASQRSVSNAQTMVSCANAQSSADPASTVKDAEVSRNTNLAPAVLTPQPVVAPLRSIQAHMTSVQVSTAPSSSAIPVPARYPPKISAVSARSVPPTPVVIPPTPQSQPARSAVEPLVRSPARAAIVARSALDPATCPAAPAPTTTCTATKPKNRKRGRPRKNPVVATMGSKGKAKAKKTHQQLEDEALDSVVDEESDLGESPSKRTARRTGKGQRRGVTDRNRRSLTIDRLLEMGFTQEDAEASVKERGDDPDACMIWIISKIEERNFFEDLNRASILSEQAKRNEEKRLKKLEKETIAHAERFMSNFSTSYIVSAESNASHLKIVLKSTIDQVDADNYLREILTKLLTLEGKSIRWYDQATRSYMLGLAGRLETALGSHDVMACCSRASASDATCAFVRKILEEEEALSKALFEMPINQGGVPPVFLECDEATKFDLEDDGFEVVDE